MIVKTSTKEPERFTPLWRLKEAEKPVYLVRAGSVLERASVEAELAGEHQAGRVFAFELLQAFTGGIEALLADDDGRHELIALAQAEAGLEAGDKLPGSEAYMLAEARQTLAQHWPPYRELKARMERRREIAPILAFRRFVIGWENVPATFARGIDGLVSMDVTGAVDPLEMMSAGNFAYGLLYAGGLEGNSQQPSKSDDGQPTSNSDAPLPAAGRSRAKGGRKAR